MPGEKPKMETNQGEDAWRDVVQRHARGLDHVAVAVADLEKSVGFYRDTLGFEVVDRRETRGARTGMVSAVMRLGSTVVVLIQGTEPSSQVTRFVETAGPGVQHIAIEVTDLAAVVEALEGRGIEFEMPMIEGPYTRQMFTTRTRAIGVRVELIERKADGFDGRSVERLFRAMEATDSW